MRHPLAAAAAVFGACALLIVALYAVGMSHAPATPTLQGDALGPDLGESAEEYSQRAAATLDSARRKSAPGDSHLALIALTRGTSRYAAAAEGHPGASRGDERRKGRGVRARGAPGRSARVRRWAGLGAGFCAPRWRGGDRGRCNAVAPRGIVARALSRGIARRCGVGRNRCAEPGCVFSGFVGRIQARRSGPKRGNALTRSGPGPCIVQRSCTPKRPDSSVGFAEDAVGAPVCEEKFWFPNPELPPRTPPPTAAGR